MISRREFLAAAPAGVLAASSAFWLAKSATVRIGCQTNAWRIDPADFNQVLGVLAKLKELGFDGFETGFRNVQGQFENAVAARRQIEKTGLQFFGAHIFLEKYDPRTHIPPQELISAVAQGAAKLGAQRVIVSGRNLGEVDKPTFAASHKASALNAAGGICKKQGLRLAYHNHSPEFTKTVTDELEIVDLIRETDPALVDFLIDCGWAFRAKVNVPEFFARHHKRIVGLHLRDFKGDEQIPLGQGDFPIKALADAIKRMKWSGWALNEEERLSGEKPGEKAVEPARETLRQVFGR
jgi:sugar phosphate isomerase/epimerase